MFKWILTGLFFLTGAFTLAWAESAPQAKAREAAGPRIGDWAFVNESGVYKIKVITGITPLYLQVSVRVVDDRQVLDDTETIVQIKTAPVTELSKEDKIRIVEQQLDVMARGGLKITEEFRRKAIAALDANAAVPKPVAEELTINNKTLKCEKHVSPDGKGPTVWLCKEIYADPTVKVVRDGKTDKVLIGWGSAENTPDYSITKRLQPKTPDPKAPPVLPKTEKPPALPKAKEPPALPKAKEPVALPKQTSSPKKDK